jgi:hypothetical protein
MCSLSSCNRGLGRFVVGHDFNRMPHSQGCSDLGSESGHIQLMFVSHSMCAVRCKSGSPRPRDTMDQAHMPAMQTAMGICSSPTRCMGG